MGPVCFLLTLSSLLSTSTSRCFYPGGEDPTFTGPPSIEYTEFPQVVQVTWNKVLEHADCADWYNVTWWRQYTIFLQILLFEDIEC